MTVLNIGVIFGGRSGEHEVSILSARSVIGALNSERYRVVPLGITKDGQWLSPERSLEMLNQGLETPLAIGNHHPLAVSWHEFGLGQLSNLDVAFPVLHGPYGEDGTVQGLLELMDVPYVGAGVAASALGMDKALMKAMFIKHGLPVPLFKVVMRRDWEADAADTLARVEQELPYPCFVKPSNLGSSVGITKVNSREDMGAALDEASRWGRKLLVERAISAREIECSVLGNDAPQVSVPGEIVPARDFYDYYAKYHDDRTQLIIPAQLPGDTVSQVQELSIKAFKAIDCAGMARVDLFIDKADGQIYVNEINTIPGFTNVSMYPKLWEASGMGYSELLDRLVQLALERYNDNRGGETSTTVHPDG